MPAVAAIKFAQSIGIAIDVVSRMLIPDYQYAIIAPFILFAVLIIGFGCIMVLHVKFFPLDGDTRMSVTFKTKMRRDHSRISSFEFGRSSDNSELTETMESIQRRLPSQYYIDFSRLCSRRKWKRIAVGATGSVYRGVFERSPCAIKEVFNAVATVGAMDDFIEETAMRAFDVIPCISTFIHSPHHIIINSGSRPP